MFDPGALTSGLLTGLREGVEAALIVSIVLAYLVRTGNRRFLPQVWLGVGAAVAMSAALGVVIYLTVGELPAPLEQLFEAAMLGVAAGVVTWMLFWMRRAAATVSVELREAIDKAVSGGAAFGLAILAFSAVAREGLETAVFLTGQATAASEAEAGATSVLVGALAGLGIAAFLGYGFYRGSRRIDLAKFFRWTGIALIFIAAGLLSQAVHELVEIGVIPFGAATAYDLSGVLPHQEGIGAFLRALFGYSSTPEQATLLTHVVYLAVVLALYLRPMTVKPVGSASPTSERAAA